MQRRSLPCSQTSIASSRKRIRLTTRRSSRRSGTSPAFGASIGAASLCRPSHADPSTDREALNASPTTDRRERITQDAFFHRGRRSSPLSLLGLPVPRLDFTPDGAVIHLPCATLSPSPSHPQPRRRPLTRSPAGSRRRHGRPDLDHRERASRLHSCSCSSATATSLLGAHPVQRATDDRSRWNSRLCVCASLTRRVAEVRRVARVEPERKSDHV